MTMIQYVLICSLLVGNLRACEILKASDCPPGPSKDDEDLMKSELYTKEQLFAFCDAGKTYSDCINERLHCCDLRVEYATTLASLEAQLKRNVWRTSRYCAGISEENSIHFRCSTSSSSSSGNTTTKPTTTPIPICNVEKVIERQNRKIILILHWEIFHF